VAQHIFLTFGEVLVGFDHLYLLLVQIERIRVPQNRYVVLKLDFRLLALVGLFVSTRICICVPVRISICHTSPVAVDLDAADVEAPVVPQVFQLLELVQVAGLHVLSFCHIVRVHRVVDQQFHLPYGHPAKLRVPGTGVTVHHDGIRVEILVVHLIVQTLMILIKLVVGFYARNHKVLVEVGLLLVPHELLLELLMGLQPLAQLGAHHRLRLRFFQLNHVHGVVLPVRVLAQADVLFGLVSNVHF